MLRRELRLRFRGAPLTLALVFVLAATWGSAGLSRTAAQEVPAAGEALPPGGTVRSLAADPFHPGRVLLGTTTGALFQSADGGAHWSFYSQVAPHDDWVVASLAPDPARDGRWYAALWSWAAPDGGIFASDNGGRSWHPLLLGHAVRALALAPSDAATLVAGTLDGVYRSQDAGLHWALISPPHDRELADIDSVAVDPLNAQEIYVGTWHLPWKTVNGGHDWWQMRQGVIDDSDVFSIAVDRQHPTTVYLSACSGIYRSDNKGNLFRKIQGIPYSARRTPALVQDPADPASIYAGTTQGLWVSHDGGATWARITAPALRVNAVLLLPAAGGGPSRILLGTDFAGVFASRDGGKTFLAANDGFANRHVSAVASSPGGRYLAVTGDQAWGGIFLEAGDPPDPAAPGESWRPVPAPLPGHDVYGLHWSPAGLLAATERGVYLRAPATAGHAASRSRRAVTDGWQLPRSAPHDHVFALVGPSATLLVALAATQTGLYKTDDGGLTWTWMRAAPAPLYQILTPASDPGWLLAAGDGFVLRSPDLGRHFLPGRLAIAGRINQLASAPGPEGSSLFFAATTRGLYQSSDQGATWTLCGHGLPAIPISAVHVQPNGIFAAAASVGFIYQSSDGGIHWHRVTLSPGQEALARSGPGLLSRWDPLAPLSLARDTDHK